MGKITGAAALFVILLLGGTNLSAAGDNITLAEFRQLYGSLLAGKTLVTQYKEDGMDIPSHIAFRAIAQSVLQKYGKKPEVTIELG